VSRALVLGGGGVTGVAWEVGVLAGLAAAGVDLRAADVVVGTSAGSSVGAQVTSGTGLEELYERQLTGPGTEIPARLGIGGLARYASAMVRHRKHPEAGRAHLGRLALEAPTVSEAERRAVIAARLPSHEWPATRLLVTAVDAHTGEFRTFDAAAGVPLVDAVAASCAVPLVWPPVTIGDRRWIDGGVRSPANADLAAGHDRVVVVAPMTRALGPMAATAQVAALRAAGARVALVAPDAAATRAIGRNPLDPARREPAARAGRAQAAEVAAEVRSVWLDD
jgi:NTE family protein